MASTEAEAQGASAREGVFYIDRRSGERREEVVFGRGFMEFFYDNALGRKLTDWVFTKPWFSKVYGAYNDSGWSRRKIPGFVEALSLPLDEVADELPSFESFNAFFARRLTSESRPLDPDPRALVSPADARIYVFPEIDGDTLLPVKGAAIPIAGLLADPEEAARFHGGGAVILRLCPADYHRFHWPASGIASAPRSIPGLLHSVSPFALEKGIDVFCRNHRVCAGLDSPTFGRLALVDVGALCVGTIVETYAPGAVERGDEKGYFKFGGSSIVLLSEPGRVEYDSDLVETTRAGMETLVRFGERIGRAPDAD